MDLLERLSELREKRGLTQAEVAEELGVSRQAISRWETGKIKPSTDNLRRLGKLYGVTLDYLMGGGVEEPGQTPLEPDTPTEQSGAKFRKAGLVCSAVTVVMAVLLALAIIYIVVAEREPDIPIPIEDLKKSTASPAPEEFEFSW